MLKKGWIVETESDDPNDNRKRLYKLTDEGRNVLEEEVDRVRMLVERADAVFGGGRS